MCHNGEESRSTKKTTKYLERCQEVGWDFVPFLMDLWGGLGPAATKFMAHYVTIAIGAEPEEGRRGTEAAIWQCLMAAVMRQVGKHLTVYDSLSGPPDASLLERAG